MDNNLLQIKTNEVPEIQFNKEKLIERVDKILEQRKGILYTMEEIPEAKKVVADLRKQKNYLNSERINACKPYEEVMKHAKSEMDKVLSKYDIVIKEIDSQIKESENVWKKEREDYIRKTYKDVFLKDIPERYRVYPTIQNLRIDPKWLLKGTTKKKIKDQMIEKRDKILLDINTLNSIAEEEFLSDVEAAYFKDLDLNKAIQKNENLREAKQKVLEAERKKKEEEFRRKEQEKVKKEQRNHEVVDPFRFDLDSIPIPEPIDFRNSSTDTVQNPHENKSSNDNSFAPNRSMKHKIQILNIKIRGKESDIKDIMEYIYQKDIEIL